MQGARPCIKWSGGRWTAHCGVFVGYARRIDGSSRHRPHTNILNLGKNASSACKITGIFFHTISSYEIARRTRREAHRRIISYAIDFEFYVYRHRKSVRMQRFFRAAELSHGGRQGFAASTGRGRQLGSTPTRPTSYSMIMFFEFKFLIYLVGAALGKGAPTG